MLLATVSNANAGFGSSSPYNADDPARPVMISSQPKPVVEVPVYKAIQAAAAPPPPVAAAPPVAAPPVAAPPVAAPPAAQAAAPPVEEVPQTPVSLLRDIFACNPFGATLLGDPDNYVSFSKPTQEATDAYDLSVVQAIRHNDVERLRTMLREGKSFNACNRFGESLIHMVCRRGNIELATFLIKEALVDVEVRDDFGRTPMHDACWTSKPNVAVMDLLVNNVSPELLLAEDVRGHTPFDYARKEHYEQWHKYLTSKEEDLQHRISTYGSMR